MKVFLGGLIVALLALAVGTYSARSNMAQQLLEACFVTHEQLQGEKRRAACKCGVDGTMDALGYGPFIPLVGDAAVVVTSLDTGLLQKHMEPCIKRYMN